MKNKAMLEERAAARALMRLQTKAVLNSVDKVTPGGFHAEFPVARVFGQMAWRCALITAAVAVVLYVGHLL